MPLLYAEHHDPEPHPDPKRFDIDRPDQSQISFGGGAHCRTADLMARARRISGSAVHRFLKGARATSSAHFRSPRQKRVFQYYGENDDWLARRIEEEK
jgi:hypothetical protein